METNMQLGNGMIKHKRLLSSLKAFLPNDKEIIQIIKYCQLSPVDKAWDKWQDIAGNTLNISRLKNISVKIIEKHPKEKQKITDIHLKSPPKSIFKRSPYCLISLDKNDTLYLLMLDNDKIRYSIFNKQWLENEFPITSNIKFLRVFFKNIKIQDYKEVFIKENNIIKSWVCELPLTEKTKENIELVDSLKRTKII
jgi:hypothetical protein